MAKKNKQAAKNAANAANPQYMTEFAEEVAAEQPVRKKGRKNKNR